MPNVKIIINTDNNAFADNNYGFEVSRILRKIATDFYINGYGRDTYSDINGNKAATVKEGK